MTDRAVTRDFTVAVFVVSKAHVLLHFHRKLGFWLPPGGHIEPGELPDEAAIREVQEETGVQIALVGPKALEVDYPRQLAQPQGIQLEDISPGHQHIDLVYFAAPDVPLQPIDEEFALRDRVGWYDRAALASIGLNDEIRLWCDKALRFMEQRPFRGLGV